MGSVDAAFYIKDVSPAKADNVRVLQWKSKGSCKQAKVLVINFVCVGMTFELHEPAEPVVWGPFTLQVVLTC